MEGDRIVEVGGDVAVGDEVRRFGRCHLDGGPQDDSSQSVASDGGPEQLCGRPFRGDRVHLAVCRQQVHRPDVVAEAAGTVMVLAVDVATDRTADRHLSGAGQHRNPQALREGGLHQLVEADASVDVNDARGDVHRVDPVQCGHIDDQSTAVLGVVTIGPTQSAGDHPAVATLGGFGRHPGDGPDDLLGIRGRQNIGDTG